VIRGFAARAGCPSSYGDAAYVASEDVDAGRIGGAADCASELRSSRYISDLLARKLVDVESRLSQFLVELFGT
jgi:hypothetical protein